MLTIIVLVLATLYDDNKNSRGLNSEIENYKHIIKEYEDYLIEDCNYEKFYNDSAFAISYIEDFNSYESDYSDIGLDASAHIADKIYDIRRSKRNQAIIRAHKLEQSYARCKLALICATKMLERYNEKGTKAHLEQLNIWGHVAKELNIDDFVSYDSLFNDFKTFGDKPIDMNYRKRNDEVLTNKTNRTYKKRTQQEKKRPKT